MIQRGRWIGAVPGLLVAALALVPPLAAQQRPATRTAAAGQGAAAKGAPAPAQKPDIKPVDPAGLKAAVAANRGKVALVNLWATWCGPCVEEFPDIVKLHKTYGKSGLVVIAVSLDEPEDWAKVSEFISGQKAAFPVLIRKGDVAPDVWIDAIDKSWRGAVPVTYVYDRKGRLSGKPRYGGQTYEDFVDAVKPLLK